MTKIMVHRYHDISCGHRVVGHESKCKFLHGHNYRIHFTVEARNVGQLDSLGRVIDFGIIKKLFCMWLENNWDHKFLLWEDDPLMPVLQTALTEDSIVLVPFNPTAENIAKYLLTVVGPDLLRQNHTLEGDEHKMFFVQLTQVVVEETRKCSASASLEQT